MKGLRDTSNSPAGMLIRLAEIMVAAEHLPLINHELVTNRTRHCTPEDVEHVKKPGESGRCNTDTENSHDEIALGFKIGRDCKKDNGSGA